MRIQIAARHCEIPDAVRSRTEDQLGKLSQRHLPEDFAPVEVDGVERAPRRLDGRVSVRIQESVVAGVPVLIAKLRLGGNLFSSRFKTQ